MQEDFKMPYEFDPKTNHLKEPYKFEKKKYVYDMCGNIIEQPAMGFGRELMLCIAMILSIFPLIWAIIPAIFVGIFAGYSRKKTALGVGIFYPIAAIIGDSALKSSEIDPSMTPFPFVIFIVTFIVIRNSFNNLPIKRVEFSKKECVKYFIIILIIYLVLFSIINNALIFGALLKGYL
ncbi:MAG: hypothetical protein MR902_06565 [Campylobacter sp.]|nr:hypothetical protein [Campylobacter sp.]